MYVCRALKYLTMPVAKCISPNLGACHSPVTLVKGGREGSRGRPVERASPTTSGRSRRSPENRRDRGASAASTSDRANAITPRPCQVRRLVQPCHFGIFTLRNYRHPCERVYEYGLVSYDREADWVQVGIVGVL